ncbi:MAG: CotH kinase family protein [Planctomycetaceae bacterium]|nr:CotH kinase family protein [Planctomycetaceae bacterium]
MPQVPKNGAFPDSVSALVDPEGGRKRSSLIRALLPVCLVIPAVFALLAGAEILQRYTIYSEDRAVARKEAPQFSFPEATVRDAGLDMARNVFVRYQRVVLGDDLARSGLPVYDLQIDPKRWDELMRTAKAVEARGLEVGIQHDSVNARFLDDGEWVDVKIKLRGFTSLHFRPVGPSLRINFPNRHLLDGIRQVNLVQLYDKGLTADLAANKELARHGCIPWEANFVVLRINGEITGLYQGIEHWGETMISRAKRTEGFIVDCYGEALSGDQDKAQAIIPPLLEAVRWSAMQAGDLPPEEVRWEHFSRYFDMDKLAWYAALTTLMHSSHAWEFTNLRFYFDPARGLFEPLYWDVYFYPLRGGNGEFEFDSPTSFARQLLNIPEFKRMRDVRLREFCAQRLEPMLAYADSIYDGIRDAMDVNPLQRHHVEYHDLYKRTVRNNARYLLDLLGPETSASTESSKNPAEVFDASITGLQTEGELVVIGPGAVHIGSTLRIPKPYGVAIQPGTKLTLGADASLIVHGSLSADGTASLPIEIGPSSAAQWGAIGVQGEPLKPARVSLTHCTVSGGRGDRSGWVPYTGSLSVHDGDVRLEHCTFRLGEADDGINPKYCTVAIEHCSFADQAGDAIDLDCCTGRVNDCLFRNVGGDGLDLSYSTIEAENLLVAGCGDKGISVGETTVTTLVNVFISNCTIGMASKDGSNATMTHSGIARSSVGVALYVKKPYCGPSAAKLEGVVFYDVGTAFHLAPGCRLDVAKSARYARDAVDSGAFPIEPRPWVEVDSEQALIDLLSQHQDSQGIKHPESLPK